MHGHGNEAMEILSDPYDHNIIFAHNEIIYSIFII